MNDSSVLSLDEGLWLGLLVFQILGLYGWCFTRSRHRLPWFQPPVVLSVVFLFYTVLGPLNALLLGDFIDRGVNLRYGFGIAWQGAAIAFSSFLVGYGLLRHRLPPAKLTTSFNPRQAWRLGRSLNITAIFLFALISGPRVLILLNPFTARQTELVSSGLDFGPFANYASLAINLLIPGILLMVAAWVKNRLNSIEIVLWFLTAAGIYTSIGFRYRLALLLSGMLILWFLGRGRQPSALLVIPAIIGLLAMAGLIGLTRKYGEGLDLENLKGLGFWEIVFSSFGESNIFLTSGGVMSFVPSSIPYVGITPLINTILFPIPSILLGNKNSADYILSATSVVYNSDVFNSGSAFLNYAEYFMMAGWPGLVSGYLLLGCIYRHLWLWFCLRSGEPVAQVAYVCTVVYLYVVVSRGYLPQVFMLFCFTVLPLFIYYYRISKPSVGITSK